jgi:2,4-dienoyl-CoA reductase-like NADH-dependent reductase (Old Yellow Enzyme family)
LKAMIEDRKQVVEIEKKRWRELAEEMSHIISYIAENLSKIEKLCEQSIVVLVNEQIDRKKEQALIEDIKTQFKDRLKESLRKGTIRKEDLEAAKEQVAALSKTTADFVRSDIYALTQLYETVHGHAKKVMHQLKHAGGTPHADYEEDLRFYRNMEENLISLVSDCRFTVRVQEIKENVDQGGLLAEKRQQMFCHLVDLLEQS